MTTLFVSPHFDDVALSCAGSVLARTRAGSRVTICTVFTESGDAGVDRLRSGEDARAATLAAAERVELGFTDAPRRLDVAPSFRALVLEPALDPTLVRAVKRALAATIRRARATEVWLPLGVGGHLDHRTVFAAHSACGPRVRFYEDCPYAFVPAFRALRRAEIVGVAHAPAVDATMIAREIQEGGCAALGVETADLEILAARLASPRRRARVSLRARLHRHPLSTLDDAVDLIEAYGSQVKWLFGGARVRELWTQHAADRRAWSERVHRLVPRRP